MNLNIVPKVEELEALKAYAKILLASRLLPEHCLYEKVWTGKVNEYDSKKIYKEIELSDNEIIARCVIIMHRGLSLGIVPLESVSKMPVINGSVSLMGLPMWNSILSYCMSDENQNKRKVQVIEKSLKQAVIRVWDNYNENKEDYYDNTYTQSDAIRANLWDRGTWKKSPKDMMFWKAVKRVWDMHFAFLGTGFYTPDTQEDIPIPQKTLEGRKYDNIKQIEAKEEIKQLPPKAETEKMLDFLPKAEEPQDFNKLMENKGFNILEAAKIAEEKRIEKPAPLTIKEAKEEKKTKIIQVPKKEEVKVEIKEETKLEAEIDDDLGWLADLDKTEEVIEEKKEEVPPEIIEKIEAMEEKMDQAKIDNRDILEQNDYFNAVKSKKKESWCVPLVILQTIINQSEKICNFNYLEDIAERYKVNKMNKKKTESFAFILLDTIESYLESNSSGKVPEKITKNANYIRDTFIEKMNIIINQLITLKNKMFEKAESYTPDKFRTTLKKASNYTVAQTKWLLEYLIIEKMVREEEGQILQGDV